MAAFVKLFCCFNDGYQTGDDVPESLFDEDEDESRNSDGSSYASRRRPSVVATAAAAEVRQSRRGRDSPRGKRTTPRNASPTRTLPTTPDVRENRRSGAWMEHLLSEDGSDDERLSPAAQASRPAVPRLEIPDVSGGSGRSHNKDSSTSLAATAATGKSLSPRNSTAHLSAGKHRGSGTYNAQAALLSESQRNTAFGSESQHGERFGRKASTTSPSSYQGRTERSPSNAGTAGGSYGGEQSPRSSRKSQKASEIGASSAAISTAAAAAAAPASAPAAASATAATAATASPQPASTRGGASPAGSSSVSSPPSTPLGSTGGSGGSSAAPRSTWDTQTLERFLAATMIDGPGLALMKHSKDSNKKQERVLRYDPVSMVLSWNSRKKLSRDNALCASEIRGVTRDGTVVTIVGGARGVTAFEALKERDAMILAAILNMIAEKGRPSRPAAPRQA